LRHVYVQDVGTDLLFCHKANFSSLEYCQHCMEYAISKI
jgi:hypothetical protein